MFIYKINFRELINNGLAGNLPACLTSLNTLEYL